MTPENPFSADMDARFSSEPSPPERGASMDKAGQEYWNALWTDSDLPEAVNPSDPRLKNWINRQYHQMFVRLFGGSATSSAALLEIGCGKSAWLPYFAKQFGFSVSGLDYSPIGCEMARRILRANGVEAEVVCADCFAPPEHMLGRFDVVTSYGVVEHFEDTTAVIRAMAAFLKPGGMLVTTIPNMVGWIGAIQKVVNKPVYDIHRPIDRAMLAHAHTEAGLDVSECEYFVSTSFGVNNLEGLSTTSPTGFAKKVCLGLLARASMLVWRVEQRFGEWPTSRLASPYIRCIARKPRP
jgi:2-polyprenyl-3-methyl-5-hydroxy-6-metoxy-1,4-benzoquinol methylase